MKSFEYLTAWVNKRMNFVHPRFLFEVRIGGDLLSILSWVTVWAKINMEKCFVYDCNNWTQKALFTKLKLLPRYLNKPTWKATESDLTEN